MPNSPAKILIVDDSAINSSVVENFVKDIGYQALVAADGEGAIECIRTHFPDLVLLDIMMPGISGIEVLERIKNDQAMATISVIMLSGNDEIETVVKCIQMGAEDFLTKPVNMTLLSTRIKNCLQRKHAMQQAEKLG
jgi:DNA-binding response OmpR family regulator